MQKSQNQSKIVIKELVDNLVSIRKQFDSLLLDCFDQICTKLFDIADYSFMAEQKSVLLQKLEIKDAGLGKYENKDEKFLKKLQDQVIEMVSIKAQSIIDQIESKQGDLNFSDLKHEVNIEFNSKKGCVGYAMAAIPDSSAFGVGTNEGDLLIYDFNTFKLVQSYKGIHSGWIISLAYNDIQNLLFSTSSDKTVKVFSVQNRYLIHLTTLKGHNDSVNGILFIDSRDMFITFGRDPQIKFWNIYSLLNFDNLRTESGKMGCQAVFVEELNAIGVGFYDGSIKFYEIFSKVCIITLASGDSNYYINSLIFDSSRKCLFAQTNAKSITTWNLVDQSFYKIKTLSVKGHANNILIHGKTLLICCDQPFIEIWDIETFIQNDKKVSLSTSMKNSNGALIIKRIDRKGYILVASSWNINKLAIFVENKSYIDNEIEKY